MYVYLCFSFCLQSTLLQGIRPVCNTALGMFGLGTTRQLKQLLFSLCSSLFSETTLWVFLCHFISAVSIIFQMRHSSKYTSLQYGVFSRNLYYSYNAVQKRTIHITHNLTRRMLYSSTLFNANLDSLAACTEDPSRCFSSDIMDPASCLHSLLPPPRSRAITSRLRSSDILPKVYTHIKRIVLLYNMVLTTTSKSTFLPLSIWLFVLLLATTTI